MFFEDEEFCYRANKVGWRILHTPSARVIHLKGGSSPVKESDPLGQRLPRYYYESRTRYFYKIYGRTGLTCANLLWWAGRMISNGQELFGRRTYHVCERQWLDIWTNWWNPLRSYKQQNLQQSL